MKARAPGLLVLWIMALSVIGCGTESESSQKAAPDTAAATPPNRLVAQQGWVRPAPVGLPSALYLQLVNGTTTADTLLAVRSDVAETVQIHESYRTESGNRGMRQVQAIPIPAGGTVRFQPGGLHVMLIELNESLQPGDTVVVTFEFAQAGARMIEVPVRVRAPGRTL